MKPGVGAAIDAARIGGPALRGRRWAVPAVIGLGIAASLVEGVGMALFIPLLDTNTATAPADGVLPRLLDDVFGGLSPDDRLTAVCAAILVAVAVRAGLGYLNGLLWSSLSTRVSHDLRRRVHDRLLGAPYGWIVRTDEGRLLNALSNETWNAADAFSYLLRMVIATATMVVYVVLLLLLSWPLALVVGATLVVIAGVVRVITRRVEQLGTLLTEENRTLATRMLETCTGAKTIRAFGREDAEGARFEEVSGRVTHLVRRVERVKVAVTPTYEVLAAVVLVGILYVSLRGGSTDLASLLVFVAVLYRLQPRVRQIDGLRVGLLSLSGSVREVAWVLGDHGEPPLPDGTVDAAPLEPAFSCTGVTFRYTPEGTPALDGVDLTIPAHTTTAIVGPSGAGKSTLVDLLLRLHDPAAGEIRLGGAPLPTLRVASLRARMALVSQDAHLFNASVLDNIAYGRIDASPAEVEAAARLARVDEFAERLPDGYGTIVGDDGVRLSGGQRQRLALARAIVRGADILVLDEATNALDSITEEDVQSALEHLAGGRTVIVVAHRLSTIRRAGHVIVLDRGRVVETGPPAELLRQGGLFATLSELQRGLTETPA